MIQTRRATPIRKVSLSIKVPTMLFGRQISQTPDSGREAALKHARRCCLSTGPRWRLLMSTECRPNFFANECWKVGREFGPARPEPHRRPRWLTGDVKAKQILAARYDKNAWSARSAAVRSQRPPYRTGSLMCINVYLKKSN